jgi:hypothetical protein
MKYSFILIFLASCIISPSESSDEYINTEFSLPGKDNTLPPEYHQNTDGSSNCGLVSIMEVDGNIIEIPIPCDPFDLYTGYPDPSYEQIYEEEKISY